MGYELINTNQVEDCNCPECVGQVNMSVPLDGLAEDFLIRTRRIVLVGEINEISSTHVCNQLQMFSLTKEPIYLYINSPGGSLSDGYAIIDQMAISSCPIWTIIRGQAHSMGAMIAAFGEKGHRLATPNSSIMLHSMVIQSPFDHIERFTTMMDYIKDDYRRKVMELAKRLKITTKQLTELMNKTKWLSPKQAMKIGLIDGICTQYIEKTINKGFG